MSAQPTKVHDPLFHFETHFPDRLSRLHIHQDFSHSVRRSNKKVKRSGARYKTQPVTFDEIQEVDEEPASEDKRDDGLKGKLQAFSRSMDGLLPKASPVHTRHYSPTLQKKFDHPPIILEKCEQEVGKVKDDAKSPSPAPDKRLNENEAGASSPAAAEARLQDEKTPVSGTVDQSSDSLKKQDTLLASPCTTADESPKPNLPSPNMAPRRQKITAKAKKRQKASDDSKET